MFCKKGVLSISQNSSENTCVGVLSFIEVAGYTNSPLEVFLGKGVLKICTRFTGEHPSQSVISIKLPNNFIETILRHGWSPVNLLQICRTPQSDFFWGERPACNFIKKKLWHRCFLVNFAKKDFREKTPL